MILKNLRGMAQWKMEDISSKRPPQAEIGDYEYLYSCRISLLL